MRDGFAPSRLSNRTTTHDHPLTVIPLMLNSLFVDDSVFLPQHDHAGLPMLRPGAVYFRECHDRQSVADFSQVRRRAVQFDGAGAARPFDHVGLKALSVGE